MRIEITEHSYVQVDGKKSWVDKGDTYTKIGDIFQDDKSCFTFRECELQYISYNII